MPKKEIPKPSKRKKVFAPPEVRLKNGKSYNRRLSEEEFLFAQEYVADPEHNQRQAAIRAGYSEVSAHRSGSDLMKRPRVLAEIARLTSGKLRKLDIDADKVLQGLAEIGFANILDFVDVGKDGHVTLRLDKIDRTHAGAIAELSTETVTKVLFAGTKKEQVITTQNARIKLADRRPALETLARHLRIIGAEDAAPNEKITLVIVGAPDKRIEDFRNITPGGEGTKT